MTDEEFIDRLNDKMINYGYIIIDRANYEYYLYRYKIKNYYSGYVGGYFHRFQLFNIKENMVEVGFTSVDMMINNHIDKLFPINWDIFEYAKRDINRIDKLFPVDFVNFILSIEGKSKEEICLKLQMLGY